MTYMHRYSGQPEAAPAEIPGDHGSHGKLKIRILATRTDLCRGGRPGMENRIRLMQLIAELDTELSKAGEAIPSPQKKSALSQCENILGDADEDDEQVICQAIHCLLRKHGLEPERYGPDRPSRG